MTPINKIEDHLVGKKYKPNICFDFKLSIPCCEKTEFGLLVDHDGENEANVNALLRLADEGKAPYCISVGVRPGKMLMADGSCREMRMNSYDLFDREYADFVVYELIPYISQKYNLSISERPEMHLVSGGSSGGISAFVMAWFHPAYFQKVYMSSPSFLGMGRGNEIPYLIRKYETKPLRIYQEYSENEPNDYFGWSRPIDEESRAALEFANYDFCCKFFPGEGHCSRYRDEQEAYIRMQWLWQDLVLHGNSPRVDRVVPPKSKWVAWEAFPGNDTKIAAEGITFDHVVKSNDDLALYCANRNEDIVYMIPVGENQHMDAKLLHATLHTIPRFEPKGVIDMAVDQADRLFVLTAIGIQCVRSYGLIDVILDLPDEADPLAIAVRDGLYVKTAKGVYRRELREICTEDSGEKRKFSSYYD